MITRIAELLCGVVLLLLLLFLALLFLGAGSGVPLLMALALMAFTVERMSFELGALLAFRSAPKPTPPSASRR